MLFKGTRKRNARQIIQRLEGVGGALDAYTSKEETLVYAVVPQAYFSRSLQLLSDIVCSSIFPVEELELERTVITDEIASYEDSPSELIFDEFEQLLFRAHPLGHPVLGTVRSVSSFTKRMQEDFFHRHYHTGNMVLFVQADIALEELVQRAEELFPSKGQRGARALETSTMIAHPPQYQLRRRQTHQHHVIIGGYAYSMHSPKRLALNILVNLLGGASMNSRLNLLLREQNGLVYHVECSYTAYSDTGMVAIYFGCAPRHMSRAIELVEGELLRLCQEPLSETELLATKRQLKGQLAVANDNPETTFLSLGKNYLHHGKVDSEEELYERIDAVSPELLHEVALEVLHPSLMHRLIYA